jgi:hypothetical protein
MCPVALFIWKALQQAPRLVAPCFLVLGGTPIGSLARCLAAAMRSKSTGNEIHQIKITRHQSTREYPTDLHTIGLQRPQTGPSSPTLRQRTISAGTLAVIWSMIHPLTRIFSLRPYKTHRSRTPTPLLIPRLSTTLHGSISCSYVAPIISPGAQLMPQ